MRIGTYNVLGLTGYPAEEASKDLGDPNTEETAKHFADVFQSLTCDILCCDGCFLGVEACFGRAIRLR